VLGLVLDCDPRHTSQTGQTQAKDAGAGAADGTGDGAGGQDASPPPAQNGKNGAQRPA
jgi:hypothetical protein